MNKNEIKPDFEFVLEGGAYHVPNPENMPDVGYLAPDLLPYIRDGERIIHIEHVPRHHNENKPSAMRELLRLTNSMDVTEIGKNGPVIAATSLEDDEPSSELHLYEAVFGRDSLFVAHELLDEYPELARATLLKLASLQGQEWNNTREEEPGRIPHEIRDPKNDIIARTLSEKRGWEWPYYGAVDATPMYMRVFAAYVSKIENGYELLNQDYQAKDGTTHKMSESLEYALAWVQKRMSANPEGFVEYKSPIAGGIENQMWRDSWDAFFHADGTLANRNQGIAALDVQRITHDALSEVADVYETLPHKQGEARLLHIQAALLRKKILENFWIEKSSWDENDHGYFAIGSDRDEYGNIRPLKIKTSDMGHMLYSRLLDGDDVETVRHCEAVVKQLFSPAMLAAGGIRTLADDQQRYRPSAYHNGTVWPAFNFLISQGLRRHGYNALAENLENRIMSTVDQTGELMEYVSGDGGSTPMIATRIVDVWDSVYQRVNRIEQPPQEVQAWTVASVLAIQIAHGKNQYNQPIPSEFEQRILDRIAAKN